jgi:hypothetical protein
VSDWQEFIASLIGSLAWPTVVLVLAWMFHSSLGRLLSGDIKRWRAGPAGVEVEYWEKAIAQARQELAQDRASTQRELVASDVGPREFRDEMTELAAISPRSAVLESFRRMELQLRLMLESAGVEQVRPTGGRLMAETALQHRLITGPTADAVRGMSTLRNLAAHGHDDREIDHLRALEFIDLAEAVLFALEHSSPSRPD